MWYLTMALCKDYMDKGRCSFSAAGRVLKGTPCGCSTQTGKKKVTCILELNGLINATTVIAHLLLSPALQGKVEKGGRTPEESETGVTFEEFVRAGVEEALEGFEVEGGDAVFVETCLVGLVTPPSARVFVVLVGGGAGLAENKEEDVPCTSCHC